MYDTNRVFVLRSNAMFAIMFAWMTTLDEFLNRPLPELEAELARFERKRKLLEAKERLLRQALSVVIEREAASVEDAYAVSIDYMAEPPLRHRIMETMMVSGSPQEWWHPRDIAELLERRGMAATVDNVRVTMARMHESGELRERREDPLRYRIGVDRAEPRDSPQPRRLKGLQR